MSRLSLILRCLMILAFCLDGSATAWRGQPDGVRATKAAVEHGDHGRAAEADVEDCPDAGADGQSREAHRGCDCSTTGCPCPCGFTSVAVAHTVPFAAQHGLTSVPTMRELMPVTLRTISPVFRPPIG